MSGIHEFLTRFDVSSDAMQEILQYNEARFDHSKLGQQQWPLESEAHLDAWIQYAQETETLGAEAVLRKVFLALAFPIADDVENDEAYRKATRRGVLPNEKPKQRAEFRSPNKLAVLIHQGPAGKIPIVYAPDRADFETLIQAISKRNRQDPIPSSMGAAMFAGFNNWDRIHQIKERWLEEVPDASPSGWPTYFKHEVVPNRPLYKDSFILLTRGPYSNVSAASLELDRTQWLDLSHSVRLEHECTHYFTRRVLGSMRNNLLDELIADYRGIVHACGTFRADWFLHFMGLENFPNFRQGGRLENYRGDPELSDEAFHIQGAIVREAAFTVERFHHRHQSHLTDSSGAARAILTLSRFNLLDLVRKEADQQLDETLAATS